MVFVMVFLNTADSRVDFIYCMDSERNEVVVEAVSGQATCADISVVACVYFYF